MISTTVGSCSANRRCNDGGDGDGDDDDDGDVDIDDEGKVQKISNLQ